jgi:tellurite methyltransferase
MPGWQELWQDPEVVKKWLERPAAAEVLVMADLLEKAGRRRILDVGCGVGRHVIYLASRGFEVTGTDNAPAGLETCRERLIELGLIAQLVECDMTGLPFTPASFDGAISTRAIHHGLAADVRRAVEKIDRALTPGGIFVWTMPSRTGTENYEGGQLEPYTWLPQADSRERHIPHHYCDEAEIREWLHNFDFIKLEEETTGTEARRRIHWSVLAQKR